MYSPFHFLLMAYVNSTDVTDHICAILVLWLKVMSYENCGLGKHGRLKV